MHPAFAAASVAWGEKAVNIERSRIGLGGNSKVSITFIAVIFTMSIVLVMTPVVSAASWSFTVVNSSRESTPDTGIAVDSKGVTHIVYSLPATYTNRGIAGLYYANNEKGSFRSVCIDKTAKASTFIDLAIDSKGCLHVAYMDESACDLLYLSNVGGKWQRTVVDSVGNTGLFPDLTIDSEDNVHISYLSTVDFHLDNTLKYASNIGGVWSISSIGPCGYNPTAIAVDSAGYAHVCFVGSQLVYQVPLPLNYITNDAGSWSAPVAIDYEAIYPSIASGTGGMMYVAYASFIPGTDPTFATLNLASSTDGLVWSSEVVDGSGIVEIGPELAIALDANGDVHIAYTEVRSSSDYHVMYAENTGAVWNIQTVTHGSSSSMALDKGSNPHIAYHNELAPRSLMCAIWS